MTELKLNIDQSKKEELLKKVSEDTGVKIETKEDIAAAEEVKPKTPDHPKKPPIDFDAVYKKLHEKSPKVFNLESPVMFAHKIHLKVKEFTGLSAKETHFWITKYIRKSKYYKRHLVGALRYSFEGEEIGVVTDDEASRMDELLKSQFKKKPKKEESDNNS